MPYCCGNMETCFEIDVYKDFYWLCHDEDDDAAAVVADANKMKRRISILRKKKKNKKQQKKIPLNLRHNDCNAGDLMVMLVMAVVVLVLVVVMIMMNGIYSNWYMLLVI